MNLTKTIFKQQNSKRNIVFKLKNQAAICRLKNLTTMNKTAIHISEALSQKHSENICGLKKQSQFSVFSGYHKCFSGNFLGC